MNTNKEEKEMAMILAGLCAKWRLLPDEEKPKHEANLVSVIRNLGFTHVGFWKNRSDRYYVEIENFHDKWRFPITNKGDIIK